jgi:hypothetical protein
MSLNDPFLYLSQVPSRRVKQGSEHTHFKSRASSRGSGRAANVSSRTSAFARWSERDMNVSSRTLAFARGSESDPLANASHEGPDSLQTGCKLCNQNVHLGILLHPDSTLSVF